MNELALKDIHLPEASLWWPPAPGWWILLILLPVLIIYLPRLSAWLRWRPIKTISLRELARIRTEMDNGLDDRQGLQQISILLRRIVISHYGRTIGASTTGNNWAEQLKQISTNECFTPEQNEWLSIGQYRAENRCDVEAMLKSCESWIKALPRKNNHAAD